METVPVIEVTDKVIVTTEEPGEVSITPTAESEPTPEEEST